MKMKTLAVATAMVMTSGLATANSYQAELGLTYTDSEAFGVGDGFGVRGEFHLNPVQTRNHPLGEAAFLEQSSNIYATASDGFDFMTVGGELFIPDTMFYVGAEAQRVSNGGSDTTLFATLGLTPIDGLLVTTRFSDDGYDANVAAKYVVDLGAGNFVNFEGEYQDGDVNDYLSMFADFYFDRTLSIGAGYTDFFGDDQFTLRARNFFTEDVAGEISVTDADSGNAYMMGVTMRF